jgi:chromosomal replication initiator protein
MSHLDNPAAKSQHKRWLESRARLGMVRSEPVVMAYQRPKDIVLEPIQAPTRPVSVAKRLADIKRAEQAELNRKRIEADLKSLEDAREFDVQRIRSIILATASHFSIPAAELVSDRRTKDIALPRQIAMYLAKVMTPQSYPNIGRRFRRDHTTVLHAVRKVEGLLANGNPVVTLAVAAIKETLNGGPESYRGA